MAFVYIAWAVSAAVITVAAVLLGARVIKRGVLGILIDERGRFSLSRFQLTAWTILVLSLIIGVFSGRLRSGVENPLAFDIPAELLVVMGISASSSVLATTIKSAKDSSSQARNIAASNQEDKPRWSQMFLLEEGSLADKAIDIGKFQNFWFTMVLLAAYIALAIDALHDFGSPGEVTALPGFGQEFVVLLGISHAGYIASKVPNQSGKPQGLTVAMLRTGAVAVKELQRADPPQYVPRNPAPAV